MNRMSTAISLVSHLTVKFIKKYARHLSLKNFFVSQSGGHFPLDSPENSV